MNGTKLEIFRDRLIAMFSDLEDQNDLGRDGQNVVTLDQQSVGRLSRMDALQRQAMAKANQNRRDLMARRIKLALERIEDGEFGYCADCGEEIAEKRLDLDPTIPDCINCANER